MAELLAVKITHQMSDAVRTMQWATGCSARSALECLLVLVAENEPGDKARRIEALAYLLRTQPKLEQG